jgi:hypothetical protein
MENTSTGFAEYPLAAQKSRAWHDQRLGRFTASEIWKLFTEPRSKEAKARSELSETTKAYILEKVAEELTGQHKEISAKSLDWGNDNEEAAKDYFSNLTGCEVKPASFVPFSVMSGGSPDGYIDETAILEIKCPFDSSIQLQYFMLKDQADLKAEFPEYYFQCQANLLFTKRDKAVFATYDPRMQDDNMKMKLLVITPDYDDQRKIVEKLLAAQKFKEQVILQFRPEAKVLSEEERKLLTV